MTLSQHETMIDAFAARLHEVKLGCLSGWPAAAERHMTMHHEWAEAFLDSNSVFLTHAPWATDVLALALVEADQGPYSQLDDEGAEQARLDAAEILAALIKPTKRISDHMENRR